jgi:hypothetical protein
MLCAAGSQTLENSMNLNKMKSRYGRRSSTVAALAVAGTFAASLGAAPSANAAPIVYTGSSGSLAASVSFEVIGTDLKVVLTNTGTGDVLAPADVLTGVGFTLAGNPTLSRDSALLNAGSSVFYDSQGQPVGGVVGGEWAYKSGISYHGATQGISSSGLGLFGAGDLFPGLDLEPPDSPDGVQYGLLSAGDDPVTGNGGITGSGGLIKNSVVFALDSLPAGFNPFTGISNVVFQYGTSLTETSFSGGCTINCDPPPPNDDPPPNDVPEPGTLLLLGSALLGFGILRRRKRG